LFLIAFLLPFVVTSPVLAGGGVVVVDAGHGGYDTGIRAEGYKEKDLSGAVARQVEEILRSIDRGVSLTRKIDQYVSISERRASANRIGPEVFLSLHLSGSDFFSVYVNQYERKDADLSFREYYALGSNQRRYVYESSLLAGALEKVLEETYDYKVFRRKMPLPLLGSVGAPAVLIEVPRGLLEEVDYDLEVLRIASAITIAVMYYEHER
jgi:N-acetylmuramoyl-L-alanine amidase